MSQEKLELWGVEDIAREIGQKPGTVAVWRLRGKIPEPEWIVSGRPIWRAETIRAWIAER